MDSAEAKVKEYLQCLNFKNIVYEPDGNIPPDFLCDGRVAVEARRLLQIDKNQKSLEESSIPLRLRMKKLLAEFGEPTDGHSWYVLFNYQRPFPKWKKLEPKIKDVLLDFMQSPKNENITIEVVSDFKLDIGKAQKSHNNQFFCLGGYNDQDAGGWVLVELEKSLLAVITEKTEKISRLRHKYQEWWLCLVDHIAYGLDELDREQFKDSIKIPHNWDKVILIDPLNPKNTFEV